MKRFVRSYCATVVEIMEERSRWQVPIGVQAGFIALFFMQTGGYLILEEYPKPNIDKVHTYIGQILGRSTGTYLLWAKKNDNLTLVVFGMISCIIYLCYIYVGVLTYLRARQKEFLNRYKHLVLQCNSILHTLLSYYYWIFLVPFIEINMQLLACNTSSFISTYKDHTGCKSKSIALVVFGALGVILSFFIGILVIFFLRNYAFNDPNPLKRNYTFLQFISLIFQIAIILTLFLGTIDLSSYVLGSISGSLLLLDLLINPPLKNQILSGTYSTCVCLYTVIVTILTIWLYTDFMVGYEVLFSSLLISILFYVGIRSWQNYQQLYLTKLISKITSIREDGGRGLLIMVKQLENLEDLLADQEKNKFKIIEMLNCHKLDCCFTECCCHRETFIVDGSVKVENIIVLIEEIFWRGLESAVRELGRGKEEGMRNRNSGSAKVNVEEAVMKFVTFLARVMNKPTKAYIELKKYVGLEKSMSFYFQLISIVLSERIEDSIAYAQTLYATSSSSADSKRLDDTIKEELRVQNVIDSDIQKREFIPKLAKFFAAKSQFWLNIISQSITITHLFKEAQILSREANKLQTFVRKHFADQSAKLTLHTDIIKAKLLSIYLSGVSAEYLHAYQYQNLAYLQLSRDYSKPLQVLNGYSILKGDMQCMRISIVKHPGKIISTKHHRLASFFGYSLSDFDRVRNIHALMPPFFAGIHDLFINNMAQRGFSPILSSKLCTFFMDSKGFLQHTNIYMTNMQGFQDDYCMQAAFLKLPSNSQFILFEGIGVVRGITSALFNLLFRFKKQTMDRSKLMLGNNNLEKSRFISTPEEIIDLKQFCEKINLHLIAPSLLKHLKKNVSSLNKKPLPPLDPGYVNSEQQICLLESASLFVPMRLLYLNDLLTSTINGQQVSFIPSPKIPSQSVFLNSPIQGPDTNTEKLFPFDLKQFFSHNKNEWKESNLYSQLKVKFNLTQKTYWYVQSDGKMANKQLYVMEIVESIDVTLNNTNLATSKQADLPFSQLDALAGIPLNLNKIKDKDNKDQSLLSVNSIYLNQNSSPQNNQNNNIHNSNSTSNFKDKPKQIANGSNTNIHQSTNKTNDNTNTYSSRNPNNNIITSGKSSYGTHRAKKNGNNNINNPEINNNNNAKPKTFDNINSSTNSQNTFMNNNYNNGATTIPLMDDTIAVINIEEENAATSRKFKFKQVQSRHENEVNIEDDEVDEDDKNSNYDNNYSDGGTSMNNRSEVLTPTDRTGGSLNFKRIKKVPSDLGNYGETKKSIYSNIKSAKAARVIADLTEREALYHIPPGAGGGVTVPTITNMEEGQNMVTALSPFHITSTEQLISGIDTPRDKGIVGSSSSINQGGSLKKTLKQRMVQLKSKIVYSKQEVDLLEDELDEDDVNGTKENNEERVDEDGKREKKRKWTKLLGNKKQIEKVIKDNQTDSVAVSNSKQIKKDKVNYQQSGINTIKKREHQLKRDTRKPGDDVNNSQSKVSSSSKLNILSQQLVQEMIRRPKKLYQDLLFMIFGSLFAVLIGASIYFTQVTSTQLQGFKTEISESYTISQQQTISSNLTLIATNLFLMFDGSIYNPLLTQQLVGHQFMACIEQGTNYQQALANAMPIVYSILNDDSNPYTIALTIFSNSQATFQNYTVQLALMEMGAQSYGACSISASGFNVAIDQMLFLSANFLQMEQAAAELSDRMLQRALGRDTLLMDGVEISVYLALGASVASIIFILVILRRHRQFKERVLLLVTRVNRQEAEKEIVKYQQCSLMLQDQNESWTEIDFVSFITTDFVMEEGINIDLANAMIQTNLKQQVLLDGNVKQPIVSNKNKIDNVSKNKLPKSNMQTQDNEEIMKNTRDQDQQIADSKLRQQPQRFKKNISGNTPTKSSKSLQQKDQTSRLVSSQLRSRNLQSFKEVTMITGLIIVCCSIICIAAVIAEFESSKLDTSVNFYLGAITTLSSIRGFLLLSNFLLSNAHFATQFGGTVDNVVQKVFIYAYSLTEKAINGFVEGFTTMLDKQSMLPTATSQNLSMLFESDICVTLNKIYLADISVFPEYILYHYNNLCVENYSLDTSNVSTQLQILSKDTTAREAAMDTIYNMELTKAFILHGFDLPVNFLLFILDTLQQGYTQKSQVLLDLFWYYFSILGGLLFFISIILLIRFTTKMKATLLNVTFALTLIPYDRLVDDNATSMLRNLKLSQ